jgi:penicillin-binding protein 1A
MSRRSTQNGSAGPFLGRVRSWFGRLFSSVWFWLALLFLAGAGAGLAAGAWQNLCADCPSVAQIATWEPTQTSKLFDSRGELIAEIGIQRRTPVSIETLPPYVPQAFVAVEDRRFYEHKGYDLRGISRAVVVRLPIIGDMLNRRAGGGSTITQQLARNMFEERIGREKRITRKLKELQVALELERAYTKDQILEAYMNVVNFDVGYGIQTAARNYFGKNATELNPAEAAMLAGVPNLPRYYNPFRNPDNARGRRDMILGAMESQGYLEPGDADRWRSWPLPVERPAAAVGVAPYFEEWTRQILDDRFGSLLYTAGLRVYTTLDVRMQRAAEAAMENGWAEIEARPEFDQPLYEEYADRTEPFESANTPYLQGVLVALDPYTGHVKAMIGGRDFRHSKFNRATQALRQPGSGFKPFVYTAALGSGIPASHVVVDAPVVLPQVSGEEWKPKNFSNEFAGPITIREGLRRSINMIAIKLGLEVGLETVAQTARRMGIRTDIPRVPATTIGAAEVIPLQMAEAYSGLATLGTKVRPFPITRVEDSEGNVLWEPAPERAEVLDPLVARMSVSLLEDVVARGTGYNAIRVRAGLPYAVRAAGKTGTTNNSTDVWFNGVTPNLVASVWFGMDQPQAIWQSEDGARGATGGGDAAPVWGDFMRRVYYGLTEEGEPAGAENLTRYEIVFPSTPDPAADTLPVLGEDSLDLAEGDAEFEEVAAALEEGEAEADPALEDSLLADSLLADSLGLDSLGVAMDPWERVWMVYDSLATDPLAPVLPIVPGWSLDGLTTRSVDSKSGKLASSWCPEEQRYTEFFIPGTEPTEVCDTFGRTIFRRNPFQR